MNKNVLPDTKYHTDKNQMNDALPEAEQRYRSYFEHAPDGVFIVDKGGRFIEANRSASRITGFSPEEIQEMSINDILAERSITDGLSHFKKIMETGAATTDLWHRHKNGTIRCLTIDAVKLSEDRIMGFAKDITERKEAEIELAERNKFIESVINMTSNILYIYDLVTRKNVYSNNGIEMNLGYSIQEVQDMGDQLIPFLMHPDDLPTYLNSTLQKYAHAKDGEQIINEYRMKHKSGEWRWLVSNETIYLRQPDGSPRQIFGMIHDTTQCKRIEEALRESKTTAERYLNIAAEIIISLNIHGNISLLNDSGHALLGYEPGELIGKTWFDTCIQSDIIEEVKGVFVQLMAGEGEDVTNYENLVRTKNGELRSIFWHNTLLRDTNDRIVGLLCSGKDITERKLAEEALAAEKERLATTLRSIGDGVITTDKQGKIVLINKVAENLTGWTQNEALGKPLSEVFTIINGSTRQDCGNPVDQVLTFGDITELSNRTVLISKNGTERIIADSGAPIRDADSNTIGVVLVFRDITEKQKLLDSAQRADKLESIGVLAGGIAHDFNNLLGGIYGYIDLAHGHCNDASKTAGFLDKALTTFSRAKDLTRQLLTFAKGGTPIRETLSLVPILKESTQFALSGSSVAASFHIANDLWLCDFNKNQLGQIIDNLVINAVQAMPLGGKITVTAENIEVNQGKIPSLKQGNYVHVSFADTGIGIPQSILPRIFDPFFTTKQKGNGLGLATVYSIIHKHDGEITVESEQDKGTTFHLYLPFSNKMAETQTADTSHTHRGSGRILIMDNEDYIREIAGDMLRSIGYKVEYAVNGDEALILLYNATQAKDPFLAAIMDLTIPGGKGGKETIKQLREFDKELVVFASSGYSEDPVMADPTEFGFTDRIIKPFRKKDLAEIFNRHSKVTN